MVCKIIVIRDLTTVWTVTIFNLLFPIFINRSNFLRIETVKLINSDKTRRIDPPNSQIDAESSKGAMFVET